MHSEILNKNQLQLLPLIKQFSREYYLAGGTAVALHIGHRRSIDFDLFKYSTIKPKSILNKVTSLGFTYTVTRSVTEQLNLTIDNVKMTFFQYPFRLNASEKYSDIIKLPSLIDLAAMKAYALGRRSKWKDYVDLYFLLKQFSIREISHNASGIFGELFSEKLFRAQLSYFDDIDYTEQVDYLKDEIPPEAVKDFLTAKATDFISLD